MKVASWNLGRGLSRENRAGVISDGLDRLDADIVFLPEAFDKTGCPIDSDFASSLGYSSLATEYDDAEPHPSEEQYIVALSRVAAQLEVVRLDARNALSANLEIEGEKISIVGAHFDDRREDIRTGMAGAFIDSGNPDIARALIGDLNAMHGGDLRARLLSSSVARSVASRLGNDRVRGLATRLTEMASGDVMEMLHSAGMQDSDPRHRSTMLMGGLAVVQLDHFMHDDRLQVKSFQSQRLKGSDHKVISGNLIIA